MVVVVVVVAATPNYLRQASQNLGKYRVYCVDLDTSHDTHSHLAVSRCVYPRHTSRMRATGTRERSHTRSDP